jgi:anti-anti-sigma regulatory factor
MSNAPRHAPNARDGDRPAAHSPIESLAPPETWSDAMAAADAISSLLAHPVDVEVRGIAVIVKVAGPGLGQRECPPIIDAAQKAFQAAHGRKNAILDLSAVQTFSAMGVGLCTDFAKRARERKLTPVLYGLRGDLLDQLRMFKIDRLFTVIRSRHDLDNAIHG